VGDCFWFIHLHKVSSAWQNKEIGCGQQRMKGFGNTSVQIGIAAAEDNAARRQLLSPVSDNYFCRCRSSKGIPPTT
jgi:hypothetical protein